MSIESALEEIAQRSRPVKKPGDYIDPLDGLLHCGICRKAKETRIKLLGGEKVVGVLCDCGIKAREQAKEQRKQQDLKGYISRLQHDGIMDNLYLNSRFENDRFPNSKPSKMARKYVERWGDMNRNNAGLIFTGNLGTGKTFYACCIANALIDKGYFAFVTSVSEITRANNEDERRKLLFSYTEKAALMVIDDLGAERATEYALEQLYAIVDKRYRTTKPLIITTNLTTEQLKNPDMSRHRIYDRILEMCPYIHQFEGDSLRENIAKEKQANIKQEGKE